MRMKWKDKEKADEEVKYKSMKNGRGGARKDPMIARKRKGGTTSRGRRRKSKPKRNV